MTGHAKKMNVLDWLTKNCKDIHAVLDRKSAALDAQTWLQEIRMVRLQDKEQGKS